MTARHPIFHVVPWLLVCVVGAPQIIRGEEVEDLKKGIVKITAKVEGKSQEGTGFVVRLEKGAVYIVTASHVVEGDPAPRVSFYPRATEFMSAQIIGIEGGDPRGVAVLGVKGNIPSDLRAFSISTKTVVGGGEPVTVIGFPTQAATPWMVTTGTIGGRKGSDLTFSGVVGAGNSGGPLLFNGRAIGVITQMGNKVGYAVPIAAARFAIEGWGIKLTEADEALLPKEITGKDGVTMTLVPAGEFLMGIEKQHIYLDAFYVDKSIAGEAYWHSAEKYCHDRGKRLPSEAEWEKAARRRAIAIGKVDEWTADWYQKDYPEIRPVRNPKGPSVGLANDEERERYEDKWREMAERSTEFYCRRSEGCDARQRSEHYQNTYRSMRGNWSQLASRDMAKVLRSDLDSRSAAMSRSNGSFRCARDAK